MFYCILFVAKKKNIYDRVANIFYERSKIKL